MTENKEDAEQERYDRLMEGCFYKGLGRVWFAAHGLALVFLLPLLLKM
ncbi:hypothetical protein ACFQ1E_04000 [Sphingomonas canadensis]|uniref:Uncharacterized protein n=1 Tax=Sphingomonas canadensis TaxID=1219257 RepID=A0ABW3H3P6_9SPHN|nr:hypothetical protein [Sphingomonas canadensis]MCW3834593.1 hypothetical protein [Sphingomonas canadensis]